MTPFIQLFFDYEEAVSLYVETRQEACRLRAITLRREILARSIHCAGCAEQIFAPGQLQAPAWLADKEQ
jgi:hypothetical protein